MFKMLRVLDTSGDSRYQFDPESGEGLADAQRVFETMKAKGYSAFNVKPGTNDSSKRIEKLEEASEETILVPKITAG